MKKVIFDCPPLLLEFLDSHSEDCGMTRAELIRFCIRFYKTAWVPPEFKDNVVPALIDSDAIEMRRERGQG